MKTIRFCFLCGEGYSKERWGSEFWCSECSAVFVIPKILKPMQISLMHSIHNFSEIELTDKKAKQAAKRNKRKNEDR